MLVTCFCHLLRYSLCFVYENTLKCVFTLLDEHNLKIVISAIVGFYVNKRASFVVFIAFECSGRGKVMVNFVSDGKYGHNSYPQIHDQSAALPKTDGGRCATSRPTICQKKHHQRKTRKNVQSK